MTAQKYASWAAEDTREASTLPSDFDAAIIAATFNKEAPDNYPVNGGDDPIFAWITYLIDEAGDYAGRTEEERTLKQAYGLGASAGKEFTISDDGNGLIPVDPALAAAIRKGSKFDLLKCSLENEGVSKTITRAGDLSALLNLRGHMRRVDDDKLLGKKREFTDNKENGGKKKNFPVQTLVMVKLLSVAGEKGAAKPAASASAAASAPAGASAVVEGDLDTQVATYLREALKSAKGNTLQRAQLIPQLSKAAIKASNRADIARRGSDEAFLMKLAEEGAVLGEEFFQITYDPAAKPQVVGIAA